MTSIRFTCDIVFSASVAALLAACGGAQPPIDAPSALPQSHAITTRDRDTSWMAADARGRDLLYVSEFGDVAVFTYPEGKHVGTLRGFDSTVGLCVDKEGDVFATNQIPARIFEYPHGGRKRIAALRPYHDGIADVLPVGCAVDPITGNLAVTGFSKHIDIFKGARGKPVRYTDRDSYFLQYCGYDDKGNLFIAGWKTSKGVPGFAELPNGSRTVMNLSLDATIYPDGGVQWDGRHVAIFAYDPPNKGGRPVIYRFAIHGSQGTKVGTTPLAGPAYSVFQFFISGDTLIAPDWYGESDQYYNVLFYTYPRGGAPTMILTKGVYSPRGAVVSFASSHQTRGMTHE